MDLESVATILDIGVFLLVIFSFFYVAWARYVSDVTIYESSHASPDSPAPNLFDRPTLSVSLILPVRNDEARLPRILNDAIGLFSLANTRSPTFSWEIIVADDSSTDRTIETVTGFTRLHKDVHLLRLDNKRGKGAAVALACLQAQGQRLWILSPDCALNLRDFTKLEKKFAELKGVRGAVIVGSRPAQSVNAGHFLNSALNFLIPFAGLGDVQDTQCGMKVLSREAARWLISNQHVAGWAFDTELLAIARRKSFRIAEVPIECDEPLPNMALTELLSTALDLLQIAIHYRIGVWTVKERRSAIKND
jgi:dolichyl-phosphate beta-glucosyltransferase